jgi:capsid protein
MSNVPAFDPTPILANRPWYERALEAVAPSYALKRLEAQVQRELFSYNASVTNRIYAPRTYGQPSESTQTTRSRIVMMWEARELVENVPQARAVSRKFGQFLTPTEYSPATGDKRYNDIVSEFFHAWCKNCDISGRHSFRKLIQLACEERPVDGDCGFAIRRVEDALRIQLVPATRIGNPNMVGAESDNYFQGVIVDDFGRPVAYRIYRVTREGVYFGAEDIPASNFTHYFDPFRIDQMRGVTDFHCSERTIRMLNEILEAEKAGVRFASQQAALVFSDRGSANPRNLFTAGPPTNVLPNGQEQQNEFSQVATIRYFGTADKVEVMPARPSNAFAGFIAHLMHEIAIGTGIPQGVLFGTEDYSGPSVRAEFAQADRIFGRHQGVLQDKVLDPIKNAVLLDAIARQEIPPPPLAAGETMVQALRRATRGEWRFPAKLTIDVGRESAANMAENRQGAKSLQEIAASEGTDAFARLEQIAAEAAYVKELSEKYGVPETAIRLTTPNLPATPVQAAAAGATIPVGPDGQPVNPEETPIDQTPTAIVDPSSEELATTEGGAPSPDRAKLIEVNFADGSYVPNNAMAANAKQALEVRASKPPSQRGMTAVGLARARDIQNKKPLSEETVRRMKAYFDRHEVDKKGSTWSEKGKGWQAWQGWGGDEGRTWANAIVERLNKQQTQNSANQPQRVELAARIEVEKALVPEMKPNAAQWLDAIIDYRRRFENKATEAVKPVTEGKTLIELSQKAKFDLPTPNMGETHDDFMTRCMSDAVAIKEFPDAAQRSAVCMRQHEGKLQKNS